MKNATTPQPPVPLRIIKKYPNRRLYDTTTSSYITLSEVKSLVMAGQPFEIHDVKSGEDITRSILLQIILEAEAGGSPMFTAPVLESLIRFYGHAMQGFLGGYLEKNIQSLIEMQTRFTDHSKGLTPEMWTRFATLQPPVIQAMMGGSLDQSQAMLTQLQEQMQKQTDQMLGALGIKSKS
ncbi:PHB/PHA accumulation regulator DNA-binding domain protein [mine drainage metagenome]|uniref:PHB/PHA accumulation regulator DNA-binding domain protein n=1 Tax=mine drainage metagenome TaxID=410659 RepID=A0A1J5PSE0_9ZZZZ